MKSKLDDFAKRNDAFCSAFFLGIIFHGNYFPERSVLGGVKLKNFCIQGGTSKTIIIYPVSQKLNVPNRDVFLSFLNKCRNLRI